MEGKCRNCIYYGLFPDFCNYWGKTLLSPDMCCDKFKQREAEVNVDG
jgi:hypothetical protein